jgi:GTP-binding protein
MIFISAKEGQRVTDVLPTAIKVGEERKVKLSTSQINRVLEDAQEKQPAPNRAGRNLRIYYGTQVRSDPPTFLLYCNDPKLLHFTYERYLENQIRRVYSFLGTPIRLVPKQRE